MKKYLYVLLLVVHIPLCGMWDGLVGELFDQPQVAHEPAQQEDILTLAGENEKVPPAIRDSLLTELCFAVIHQHPNALAQVGSYKEPIHFFMPANKFLRFAIVIFGYFTESAAIIIKIVSGW